MRYLHYIVLLVLFWDGKNINQLRNLGFMCFFTVYVSSESLYRKTSVLLNIFIAFFIFGQYYFSLTYYRWYGNKPLMETLKYMNMYEEGKIVEWDG